MDDRIRANDKLNKCLLSRRNFLKYCGLTFLGASTGFGPITGDLGLLQEASGDPLWQTLRGIDCRGAQIGVSRIDPLLSYAGEYEMTGQSPATILENGITDLLASYIQSDYQGTPSEEIWEEIEQRIDYTYEGLEPVLKPILGGRVSLPGGKSCIILTGSGRKLRREVIRKGKKLLFKPNIVSPEVLGYDGSGSAPLNQYGYPGSGVQACTDWSFLAALMRWFHDHLDITYHQMAVGEASPTIRLVREVIDRNLPFDYALESVLEGRISRFDDPDGGPGSPLYYGGYPFYFVRKYLQRKHNPDHQDDPMQGLMESQQGIYLPPGAATQILPIYNLNNAEAHTTDARGRVITFSHGAQYNRITVHKAIIGDPDDPANYPGCVLVNVPKLKVHNITATTNAIKNLGIGLWPMESGVDADPHTPDFKYSLPSSVSYPGCAFAPFGSFKGGVYHSRQSHGIQYNCDGAVEPSSIPDKYNDGIKGTMVDIDCAVIGRHGWVPYTLHVCDAITVTNVSHTGAANGYSKNEGLILASEDPVALDLFGARYMYKNVSRGQVAGHPFAMYSQFGDIKFDADTNAIVSSTGVYEFPVENDPLFAYAESRGLGTQRYHVVGLDLTANNMQEALLASRKGHFGRLVFDGEPGHHRPYQFEEILAQPQQSLGLPPYYVSMDDPLCTLQNTLRRLAIAVDEYTQRNMGFLPGYEAQFDAADLDGDGKLAIGDDANNIDALLGIMALAYSFMAVGQMERCEFHAAVKLVKYAEPAWNQQSAGTSIETIPFVMALMLASQPESANMVDPFFNGTAYGLGKDGKMRWPSLQWSRYLYELNAVDTGYQRASEYAAKMGYSFRLSVPGSLPYFPYMPNPFLSLGLPGIEETDEQDEMFVARFYNSGGEEVEEW
jgi:hypothetical protein